MDQPFYGDVIQALAQEIDQDFWRAWKPKIDFKALSINSQLEALNPSQRIELIIDLLMWLRQRYTEWFNLHGVNWHHIVSKEDKELQERVRTAICQLLKRKLPFSHDQLFHVWQLGYGLAAKNYISYVFDHHFFINLVENYLKGSPDACTPEIASLLKDIAAIRHSTDSAQVRKTNAKIERLLRDYCGYYFQEKAIQWNINPGEFWADAAIAELKSLPKVQQRPWSDVLIACASDSKGSPTEKWLTSVQPYWQAIGPDSMGEVLIRWFRLVPQGTSVPRLETHLYPDQANPGQFIVLGPDPNQLLNEQNADILKGLVWITPAIIRATQESTLASAVAILATYAYQKVGSRGPRCGRLGNACLWALGAMDPTFGIPQLTWLRTKVKLPSVQKTIERVFYEVAKRLGLPLHEVEEMSVPTYGLEDVGSRREIFGTFRAELVVTGTATTEIHWFKPDGQPQKSVPAAIKKDWAEDLKELKQAAQEIQKMLPAQRDRIEGLYCQPHSWSFATWQQRYLDHPLVGTLARRLIWQFQAGEHLGLGIWFQGQIINANGDPLSWLDPETQVTLWHPIHAAPETIMAWRQWLLDHEVQQPFKQAHREVYLLTPAEETTHTYSNRFAAHILKQHIFHALCGQRGWKNQLRLMVDDNAPPAMKALPQLGIRAEFWVGGIGEEITQTGTFLYVSTDQVRFYPQQAPLNYAHVGGGLDYSPISLVNALTPLPLEQIPAQIFSEVMRDVDLFVGVASVGNDPTWVDGGVDGRHRDYWEHFSFGELGASAATRKQVLETLIPRLKIRDRCRFEERFLVVEGALATYRIHLGSGNILMDPGQRYLCIVPGQLGGGSRDPQFLPFEGDHLLAVIISKALLLAADSQIKDETILRQIMR